MTSDVIKMFFLTMNICSSPAVQQSMILKNLSTCMLLWTQSFSLTLVRYNVCLFKNTAKLPTFSLFTSMIICSTCFNSTFECKTMVIMNTYFYISSEKNYKNVCFHFREQSVLTNSDNFAIY